MLKSYKSSLNLNSYKLDTRGYEEKIRDMAAELAALKAELAEMKAAKPRGRPRKAEVNQADGDDQDTAAECGEFDRSSAA